MLVSSSVVIQQSDSKITHSGSGLLLPGSNYVLTSPIWLIQGDAHQRKYVFSVSLQCAGNTVSKRDAILVTVAPIPKLVGSVQRLLKDVYLPDAESGNDVAKLCSIAVLQIKGAPLQCRETELSNTGPPITAGNDVYVRGTPFGDHCLRLFINSMLVGCVCGVSDDGVLFITDCVLPVGCEGAPVYCKITHSLIGLVLSAIYTKSGHPSGLSLCYSINALTSVLHAYISGVDIPRSSALKQSTAMHEVVSVHTGSGAWGTGMLVRDDIIVTCAHVIQKETGPYSIRKQMGLQCSVVYCSNPGQAPDLAILKVNNPQGQQFTHSSALPVATLNHDNISEAVAIISYGLFRPHDENAKPLITKGAICKVIQQNNIPMMIQTTAVVAAGSSGGILVSLNTGHPIGIVVSYAKDDTNNVTYPRINFCIPLLYIWQPLSDYIATKDPVVFQRFYDEQLGIKEIWQLKMSQPNMKCKL